MNTVWIILSVAAAILLVAYWSKKNAVWGGLTLGLIIGLLIAIFSGFAWYTVMRGGVIGTLIGFGAELLGLLSTRSKTR